MKWKTNNRNEKTNINNCKDYFWFFLFGKKQKGMKNNVCNVFENKIMLEKNLNQTK